MSAKMITIRVTDEQHQQICKEAAEIHTSFQNLCLSRILQRPVEPHPGKIRGMRPKVDKIALDMVTQG